MTLLLTGATGFVGGELLARVLERTSDDIVALVRADDDDGAQRRIDETLNILLAPGSVDRRRVRAVAAHLDRPDLGLTADQRQRIASEIAAVVHCAANVEFTLPLSQAHEVNVQGTRRVLELAAQASSLKRFLYVSTAFVAGHRAGRYRESEFDVGQAPRNTYEQTKLVAELEVLAAGLTGTVIARPSIIVGDSRTGWTSAFNVIYWPLQAFARGLFPVVPADPRATIDIVPVDAVADALLELLHADEQGAVHIVAGEEAPALERLAYLAATSFGVAPPTFVPPGEAPDAERRAGPFLPYLHVCGVFDGGRRHATGLQPPAFESYFDALMAYARLARWGRCPQPRWAVTTGGRMQRTAA